MQLFVALLIVTLAGTEVFARAESGDQTVRSADESRHGQVQFVSSSVDSFHVIFGYNRMLDHHIRPVVSGELVPLHRPYTRAVVIARGFRDKEVVIPRNPDRQAVVTFSLQEIDPGKIAESRYPMIHWDANLFLVAEPGTRFELDAAPLRGGNASTIQRMEYLNENTLLLRMWPGTYGITAHYADGSSWSEEVRVDFDALYDDVRKHRRRTNTLSVLRYAFGGLMAGTYLYNVIDGGRAPDTGFREYRGVNPFLDMDQCTGAPTIGIRYSPNREVSR